MSYDHGNDPCLSLWAAVYGLGLFDFPIGASVLEIGSAEADWITPMLALRPDLQMTSIDWREQARPGVNIRGDVLTHEFPDASFDAIVGISSLEHVGLGHYEADPLDADGDTHCLQRCVRWLKPSGWLYCDVPYDPRGYRVVGTKCRVYDDDALVARLGHRDLRFVGAWFTTYTNTQRLIPKPMTPPAQKFHYVALCLQKAA